ncbi:MAG: hypothetical protein R3185_01210, partial [Candidatus Thermoplasmatota archaeon]|nr:hypothetical protein [Candidatus Thermoplasmatota archaeon]
PFGPILVTPRPPLHDPDAPLVGLPKKGKTTSPDVPKPDGGETTDDQPANNRADEPAAPAKPA